MVMIVGITQAQKRRSLFSSYEKQVQLECSPNLGH